MGTETIVKIDKFNIADLQSVGAMKMRAKVQYGGDGNVFMIKLPKELFDEKYYDKIPDGFDELFDKYKTKI